jgi:hypothetical protein
MVNEEERQRALDEQTRRNMAECERLVGLLAEHEKEMAHLLAEAERLQIDLDLEIPWDQLPAEHRAELERLKLEADHDLAELQSAPRKPTRARRPRGLRI